MIRKFFRRLFDKVTPPNLPLLGEMLEKACPVFSGGRGVLQL